MSCYITEMAGAPVLIQGDEPLTAQDRAALAEVVQAALRRLAAMPPGPLSVPCPTCRQPSGEFCRNDHRRVAVHPSRRAAVGGS